MFFEGTLTPQKIIIEAKNEAEFQEKIKKIPVSNFVYKHHEISKNELKKELVDRHVYLEL